MNSSNQSFSNNSRRSNLFSNRSVNESMASRQSREDSFISTNRFKSSFYEGKVSFGGSSAKRLRLSQNLPYNITNKPTTVTRIKDSEIKRNNEINDHLTNASKNMLQNLYKESSLLEDAKRIPVFDSSINDSINNEKYLIDVNKSFKRLSSTRTPKLAPSLKPSTPANRDKLQLKWEELENSSAKNQLNNTSNRNLSSRNVMQDTSYLNKQHNSTTGKLRRGATIDKNDLLPTYELPEIRLPIDKSSLPKFNFNKGVNIKKDSEFNMNNKRPLTSITQEDDDSLDNEFKFSAPKAIKLEKISESFLERSIRNDLDKSSSLNFQINNQQTNKNTTSTPPSSTGNFQLSSSIPMSTTNLETNKTVEMYKLDKLDTDFNPKENKATLANTNTLPIKSTDSKLLTNTFNYDGLSNFNKNSFLPNNKQWECDTCSVRNELSENKCIACGQPKLKELELKDKNINNLYSNYTFPNINTEKKEFNAFKFDNINTDKSTTSSTESNFSNLTNSIVSSSNSILSNTLNTVNTINNSPITTSSLINQTNDNNKSIVSSSDKLTSSPLKSMLNTTTTGIEQQEKPKETIDFISNEIVDKINNSNTKLNASNSSSTSNLNTDSKTNTTILPTNSWGIQFQKPKDTWSCPSCFVVNKLEQKKCPCCEEPNPNEPKQNEDNKTTKSAIKFPTDKQTSGGFKFGLTPSTTSDSNAIKPAGFSSLFSKPAENTSSNTGFSFGNLTASAATNKSNEKNAPQFSFGIGSTANNKPLVNLNSSDNKNSETTNNSNLFSKSITTSNELAKTNIFSSAAAVTTTTATTTNGPSVFTFGSAAASSVPKKSEEIKQSNFVFGSSASNAITNNTNLNNSEESKSNLPVSNTNLNPQSNSFFPTQTTTNSQSTSFFPTQTNSLANNVQNSFNQFNKPQFGLPPSSNNNIFSGTQNLTNGFNTGNKDTSSNMFSSGTANLNPPINYTNIFSATPSFNFGVKPADQSQPSVFQFSGQPNQIAPIVNPVVSLQGRQIKKAKRRLGSKE